MPTNDIEQSKNNNIGRLAYIITLLWLGILIFYADSLFTPFIDWLNSIFMNNEDYVDIIFMIFFMIIGFIPCFLINIFLKINNIRK